MLVQPVVEAQRAYGASYRRLVLPRTDDLLLRTAPLLVALLVYAGAYAYMQPVPTGDEPHYVLYAHSLVVDGDADLANNYDPVTLQRYFPGVSQLDAHARDYRGDGTLHSIHYLGLPILISPLLLFGGGVGAVRALMLLLGAILAHQLFGLLRESRIANLGLIWATWIATALSLPLVAFSGQIFPELPGALILVVAIRVFVRVRPSRRSLLLVSVAAAALPWLHFRFVLFMGGLALGIAYHLLHQAGLGGSLSRLRAQLHERRPRNLLAVFWPLLLPAVSLLGLALVTNHLYGSPWPPAMYAPEIESIAPWSLAVAYQHGLGAILSPADGWLPFAPVHWLGLVGIVPLALRFRRAVPAVLLFVGMYFVLVAGPVWVGHSLPARYLIVVIPLVAAPLLYVLSVSRPARLLFVPLLALSLVLTFVGVQHHTLLYPDGSGMATLPVANRLQEIWPDFGADARPATVSRPQFTLQPSTAPRQIGQIVDDVGASVAYADPAANGEGMLAYGPYRLMGPGRYVARFHLAARGNAPIERVATVDVMTDLPVLFTIRARRELRLGDLPTGGGYTTIELPFTLDEPTRVETRVQYQGETELWLGSIDVLRTTQPETIDRQFPSWPRAALWVVGTAFVGGLLASTARTWPCGPVHACEAAGEPTRRPRPRSARLAPLAAATGAASNRRRSRPKPAH